MKFLEYLGFFIFFLKKIYLFIYLFIFKKKRTLGTPTEEIWPGVTSLPDYKQDFPSWKSKPLHETVPGMDPEGLDLLQSMLQYDPARRIAARQALKHPYFNELFTSSSE